MTTTREAALEAALKRSTEGWANAMELGLIPERHRNTAFILRDAGFAAIATPATEPQGYVEITEEMIVAGRKAADDQYYKWRGFGPREEGQGLDGMHFIVSEALRAALAARPAPQPAADETMYREGFPDGWHMVHRSDTTLLCRKSDAGYAFAVSSAFAAAPKLMQGEAWLSTAQALAWGMVNHRKAEMAYDEKTFCDHCGYGPKRDEDDKVLPNSLATKTWTCDHCAHVNKRSTQPAADTRVVTVEQLQNWRNELSAVACRDRIDDEIVTNLRNEIRAIIGTATPSDKIAEAAYTQAIGEAGDAYIKSVAFKGEHHLPAQFRWHELWDAMRVAALAGQGETP